MGKKVGIVGLGYGRQVLLAAFRRIPDCQVVAIAASSQAKAESVAREEKIAQAFGSWEEMLEKAALDIVAIAVPAPVQVAILHEAFRRKIAVLAEKPLCMDREEAEKLRHQRLSPFAIDFEFPEHPAFAAFEKQLRATRLQDWECLKVRWTMMTYANRSLLSSWKSTPSGGGGVLSLFGSHVFHHLDRWFGDVKIETADIGKSVTDFRAESETWMRATGKLASGLPFEIFIDTASSEGPQHRYELISKEETLVLENSSSDYLGGFQLRGQPLLSPSSADGRIDAVEKIARRLIQSIESGAQLAPGIEEAYRVEKAMDEFRALAESPDRKPELDIVIPVYNEGENIRKVLQGVRRNVRTAFRVLIVYDFEEDNTLAALNETDRKRFNIQFVRNEGKGAHGAVVTGFRKSTAPYVLVFPADDVTNAPMLDAMVAKARDGAEIVCASRFIPGGCMKNCPWLKALLVRTAAFSLYYLARLPAHDATNGFRLFSQRALNQIVLESTQGFTYSIELLVKAHRLGFKIGEVPARWFEREEGKSRFQVLKWIPAYLRWYLYAFKTTWLRMGPSSVIQKAEVS